MAKKRTVDLLPQVFQTDTNKKFLSATLDQLTQEPSTKRINGYVGKKVGPGVNSDDSYVVEPTKNRNDYQLDPGVVFLKTDTNVAQDAITYPGLIDALKTKNALTDKQDRLWESQYYSWDPFVDLDKFSNYSQYYWVPSGPDSIDITNREIELEETWTVTSNSDSYSFSDEVGKNPTLTLARGGSYQFEVNQDSKFWIQLEPGVSGRLPYSPNISSRDVLGVVNNGISNGVIEFNVPQKTQQDFYYTLTDIGTVDLVSTVQEFQDLNHRFVDQFLEENPYGIDGITDLNNRTVIFTTGSGWSVNSQFDSPDNGFDTQSFAQSDPVPDDEKYQVYLISYIEDEPGNPYMQLNVVKTVNNLEKFTINYGEEYSSEQWYKNADGEFQAMPLLSAVADTIYYQDAENPARFGEIKLVDTSQSQPIFLNDIVGAKNYTSPNGVTFTNGMKIQLRGAVFPAKYENAEFYVEGVGSGPGTANRVGFVDGKAYYGDYHVNANGQTITGKPSEANYFQQFIYQDWQESIDNKGAGIPVGATPNPNGQSGAVDGCGIRLIPVDELITPETYTETESVPYDSLGYDNGGYDTNVNAPLNPDYLTINRASEDRNAWSRSNRWFHIDVLRQTAEYNNQVFNIDNDQRAKRPIVEFRADLKLFNYGTQAKPYVNVIDFSETDAFSNINGTAGYGVDGYTLIPGSRIIFANDSDPDVANKIYQVDFVDFTDSGTELIDLVPVADATPQTNQTVLVVNGNTQQGQSYWFNGTSWVLAQNKTNINQAPLFDIYGADGKSFSDQTAYPSTTFAGSRLFGYADSTSTRTDEVLGFPLKYSNINNVGDILFQNYLYTDTFIYVENTVSSVNNVSTGFVRQYLNRTAFSKETGWQQAAAENRSRQIYNFDYADQPLVLDVPVSTNTVYPAVQIFISGDYVDPTQYTYTIGDTTTTIVFNSNTTPETNSAIEVAVLSDVVSQTAYYEVPINLENNPLNKNSTQFTLGTIRSHYESIGKNLIDVVGPISGANNTRDLGNILVYGDKIVQNSAPATLAGVFMRKPKFDAFKSILYNSNEYQKYKNLLLELTIQNDYTNLNAKEIVDAVVLEITEGRSSQSPFYWSDMLPATQAFDEITYTVTPITTNVFDVSRIYDFTTSNFYGLEVYLNNEILVKDYDYTVGVDSSTITVNTTLVNDDVILIREYSSTYGSFVPNTPTKMGLYPAFKPEKYLDSTYVNPVDVIRGHDGSITVAFGDIRDDVLLEFETRIFNNLKIQSDIPLDQYDVIPGQFRNTGYNLSEINQILSEDFLSWVGYNKLNYTNQTYLASNEFTYNYSQCGNRLDGKPLLGSWRGIYLDLYDTDTPNTTPWEMLGFSQMPSWWETTYGPAPYTAGNMVLWNDLSNGIVKDPDGHYVLPQFVRPRLSEVIPAGDEGELLPPTEAVVGQIDSTSFRKSWVFGDNGPVENVWRQSSAWPFAVMRLLALTKPAKFFSLLADRDRYVYNNSIEQFVWDDRYRLDGSELSPIYGNGTSKASFINWIVDYNRQLGVDSTTELTTTLSNIDVRLCWRLASYTDKNYLKIFTERSTPNSENSSLLLPDESYQLVLHKNQPINQISYSSLIIQRTESGYSVLGYNTLRPYFVISKSQQNGNTITLSAGGSDVTVSASWSNTDTAKIPYGFEFQSLSAVCDFILSYGYYLDRNGFVFDTVENGKELNWEQMAQEFLYWANQGWTPGTLINLNPGAVKVTISAPGQVVDSIAVPGPDNVILNQNRKQISPDQMVVNRLDNTFSVESTTENTINYINAKLVSYEHMVILNNVSMFADLIYDPITGARQGRVKVAATVSSDWDGTVNAPGFVLNQDNIEEWDSGKKYAKGEIVLFKNEYWTASQIIQPGTTFDYTKWIKSDYDQIQKGLLPNAANSSNQLAKSYSVFDANLEQDVDLFSYGLIGFRPRKYMQNLNLDDISQVNLYQQFLGSKGTRQSAELFSFADLDKEIAEYDIYEYWSILRSTYGATSNRSYFELKLDESKLESNPSLIEVVEPGESSVADQTVLVDDIWKSSYKITNGNILPTTTVVNPDSALPTAGYPKIDDVDYTVFDLDLPDSLTLNFDDLSHGDIVWVAKVNDHDWGIFELAKVPGIITEVSNNLNEQSAVRFTHQHNLVAGDKLIIKGFDDIVNGVYTVQAVIDLTTLLIDFAFEDENAVRTGEGIGLTLQSARVAQPADIANLPDVNDLTPGSKVWVDNNGSEMWTVLQKVQPFVQNDNLTEDIPIEGSRYGSSVAQGFQNLTAMIGAPGYGQDDSTEMPGAIYTLVQEADGKYTENSVLQLNSPYTVGYGNAIDIGDQQWAIAGAAESNDNQGYATIINSLPGDNVFKQTQVLVAPDSDFTKSKFGTSVIMSEQERWAFVGAPDANKVYAFARVDVEKQSVTYTTDGTTSVYNWADYIKIDSTKADQLIVTLNDVMLYSTAPDQGFSIDSTDITLLTTPDAGQTLKIQRRQSVELDSRIYLDLTADSTVPAGGSGASFSVNNRRGLYNATVTAAGTDYNNNDVLTINGNRIGGTTPANNLTITVTQTGVLYYSIGDLVSGSNTVKVTSVDGLTIGQTLHKSSGDGAFASGVSITDIDPATKILTLSANNTATGAIIFFASPGPITEISYTGSGISNNSSFDLTEYFATIDTDNIFSFTVKVNGQLYRPLQDYSYSSGTLTFDAGRLPPLGAEMVVENGSYYQNAGVLTVSGLNSDARFGQSVTTSSDGRTVYVGAPDRTYGDYTKAGSTYVFARSVEKFTITDPNTVIYNTENALLEPTTVLLNGNYLKPNEHNLSGSYSVTGANQITLNSDVLSVGDILQIETNQFVETQAIVSNSETDNSEFGYSLTQCLYDCSLFVGKPKDSAVSIEAGSAEYWLNQSRVYGSSTTTVANPTLTPGEYIRINNYMVSLSDPATWSSSLTWTTGVYVENLGQVYQAIRDVPAGIDITDAVYWRISSLVEVMATDISNLLLTVTATPVADVNIVADGSTKTYDIGTVYSSANSYNARVYINRVLTSDYTYNNDTQQITFDTAPALGDEIMIQAGRLTVSVTNGATVPDSNKLEINPGTGTLFADLGFDTFVHQQTIQSPVLQDYSRFGHSVELSGLKNTLAIGAPQASMIKPTTFDSAETTFDYSTCNFEDQVQNSGAVYTYDFAVAANASQSNPSQYVFGQQIINSTIDPLDRFGEAIDYTTGVMLIGAPYNDDPETTDVNYGKVVNLSNPTQRSAWDQIEIQQPFVAIDQLNATYMYDRISNSTEAYFDFFDPLQGRLLGPVRQNLDYIGSLDPASYNVGDYNNFGSKWASSYVGQMWWNTTNTRFINPQQRDEVYASRRWGQLFPDSTVEVYQWIESDVTPFEYTGPGSPLNQNSYTINSVVTDQGTFVTKYYFWVSGISTISQAQGKTLSAQAIAQYIENPRASGISYIAPINSSTLAIYNTQDYISAQDTVLHVEFDKVKNDDAIYYEKQLIPAGREDGFLDPSLYVKFVDSLCGVDKAGSQVPDPFLNSSEKYGVAFRPRQSFFVDRMDALKNYLTEANRIMAQYPLTESRDTRLLRSHEPEPTAGSGAYDMRVANIEELSYQDLNQVPIGYKYLVANDSNNKGLWTIYQVITDQITFSRDLLLIRVETYDTTQYWSYIDWYKPGYDPTTRISTTVPVYSSLFTIDLPVGSSVKVSKNGQNKWEIYLLNLDGWERVGLQDGTIAIDTTVWDYSSGNLGFDQEVFDAQYFDQQPTIETRKIIESLNNEIFTGDLLVERNNLLILMFDYILSEQQAPEWLNKTSLIDVEHTIRDLNQFQIYRKDNQDFVLNYIKEVKPYHVQIREFNLRYRGFDTYDGTVNDFDLPAYWSNAENTFISPVLDDTLQLSTTSSVTSSDPIWQTLPYDQWYQNYLLGIESVNVSNAGSGYTTPPEVIVTGECVTQAVMQARINSEGEVIGIDVINPGEGYSTTAILTLSGGNGTGATAVAVMGNSMVRQLKTTIKYDRYQYNSDIVNWQPDVEYAQGVMVREDNRVWSANSAISSTTFDPADWTIIPAGDLSGVDRTQGYYVATENEKGLDLAQLITGIDYPGVQVYGPDFDQNTGFDIGNFDINPFENIFYNPDGTVTYDPAILDAIYESEFDDPYLGTLPAPDYNGDPTSDTGEERPGEVVVDGGEFIDTYSSHAPEELIPGSMFDTLDMRVYTVPGADWTGQGSGFRSATLGYEASASGGTFLFASEFAGEPNPYGETLENITGLRCWNVTTGRLLELDIDYTVDWVQGTFTLLQGFSDNDDIAVEVYQVGGGNQLFIETYQGDLLSSSLTIPMTYSLIEDVVLFVNGIPETGTTWAQTSTTETELTFARSFTADESVVVVVFGENVNNETYSWSTPITQTEISDGSTSIELNNGITGSNISNMVVTRNGLRLRAPEGAEYTGDASTTSFALPWVNSTSQSTIADNDVTVYVDDVRKTLGIDYTVSSGSSNRTVDFVTAPADSTRVTVYVHTASPYYVSGNTLIFKPVGITIIPGDVISITTWGDTREQGLLTQVFVGPASKGVSIQEGYEDTTYDEGTVSFDPGAYDYEEGIIVKINEFDIGKTIQDSSRLIVTKNGRYLAPGINFSVNGSKVILTGAAIAATDVVVITSFTDHLVNTGLAFRLFHDMRNNQKTYRIDDATTTVLTAPVASTDDVIYVDDASKLANPNLQYGIFGSITINGERILYRNRDTSANTISGLRRGSAGTGAANHAVNSYVYDIGVGNLLPTEYQNITQYENFTGDGSTTTFVSTDVVSDEPLATIQEAVEVYVAGTLQTTGYTVSSAGPITVVFDTAPTNGYQVTISLRKGLSWYTPGASTASNGVPLQETTTLAARFIRSE